MRKRKKNSTGKKSEEPAWGRVGYSGIQWKEVTALYPSWNAGNRGVYTYQNSSNHMPDL